MEKVCYYLISNVMGNNLPLTAYGHTGIGGRKNDMKTGGWVVGRSDIVVSVCVCQRTWSYERFHALLFVKGERIQSKQSVHIHSKCIGKSYLENSLFYVFVDSIRKTNRCNWKQGGIFTRKQL